MLILKKVERTSITYKKQKVMTKGLCFHSCAKKTRSLQLKFNDGDPNRGLEKRNQNFYSDTGHDGRGSSGGIFFEKLPPVNLFSNLAAVFLHSY